jgi:hypothetical protein
MFDLIEYQIIHKFISYHMKLKLLFLIEFKIFFYFNFTNFILFELKISNSRNK